MSCEAHRFVTWEAHHLVTAARPGLQEMTGRYEAGKAEAAAALEAQQAAAAEAQASMQAAWEAKMTKLQLQVRPCTTPEWSCNDQLQATVAHAWMDENQRDASRLDR